jgi:TPR repeat protein
MYEIGQGVKQNMAEALRLFQKAAAQGGAGAKENVKRAERELSKQQQATLLATPASPLSLSTSCANCSITEAMGSLTMKSCARCKAVVYCGKECQIQHWKAEGGHRAVCK